MYVKAILMPRSGIYGPMKMIKRPLATCNQQIAVVLNGDKSSIDTEKLANELSFESSVSVRPPVGTKGDFEVVVATRGGIITSDEVHTTINDIETMSGSVEVAGWRIESE